MQRWMVVGLAMILLMDRGWYRVHAQQTDYCSSAEAAVIKLNSSAMATLDDNSPVRLYCFEGQAGDEIIVTAFATSGDLDPVIELFNDDLTAPLASNDDISATNFNAELTYVLPATGRYVILVTRFGVLDGATSGDYVLVLQTTTRSTPTPTPTVMPNGDRLNVCDSPLTVPITYDDTQRGLVDDVHVGAAYCFEGRVDDALLIEAVAASGDLDTLLYLADPFYETIFAQNDDSERGNSDSAIVDFRLPADGQYLVVVTRFGENDGQTSGEFELTVRALSGEGTLAAATPVEDTCANPMLTMLSANAWQSLLDDALVLRFYCDGTVVQHIGAVSHTGIYYSEDDILLVTFAETGETYVWGDVFIVQGFFNGVALDTNEEFYFIQAE